MMNIVCCICHEAVRVPVRFICFPCQRPPNQPSCNSITRVCLMCAREYLQLNKPRSQRTHSRKCLTCPATVRCSHLNAFLAYEKDYLFMSFDTHSHYSCFYRHQGCEFQGTQNELDHHLQSDCLYRIISCSHCKMYYEARNTTHHLTECPQLFCCHLCGVYLSIKNKDEHLVTIHSLRRCPYCQEWIHLSNFPQHLQTCPERPCECVQCHQMIERKEMYNHLVNHVQCNQREIEQSQQHISHLLSLSPLLWSESLKFK